MDIPYYQIDAFTDRVFAGNPAGVCPLDAWLSDEMLQSIAAENNLSETAFFIPDPERGAGHYHLRWFTPTDEVDLCGHATMASAYALFTDLLPGLSAVTFRTRSGDLAVVQEPDGSLTMDFPELASRPVERAAPLMTSLEAILGRRPIALLRSISLVAVYESDTDIHRLRYNPALIEVLAQADAWGLIATAPGRAGGPHDFVSRVFSPLKGVPEDPVTGSAHCTLAPYWAGRLGKTDLTAYQASHRGGTLRCRIDLARPGRVYLSGVCVPYLKGLLRIG